MVYILIGAAAPSATPNGADSSGVQFLTRVVGGPRSMLIRADSWLVLWLDETSLHVSLRCPPDLCRPSIDMCHGSLRTSLRGGGSTNLPLEALRPDPIDR